jgi:site-specific DNA-methyltransferase (adenine-specific)
MTGLTKSWQDERVFVNPPYSKLALWVEKCYNEAKHNNANVVMLIPVRSDTKTWHKFVMKANKITFVKGRLKFGNSKNSAPFPSCVVEFNPWSVNSPPIETMDNK